MMLCLIFESFPGETVFGARYFHQNELPGDRQVLALAISQCTILGKNNEYFSTRL